MSHASCITDIILKTKAKELFFTKGNLSASTQEIADFAGVKRTLVNYYFGSKRELFQIVYKELIDEMKSSLSEIYMKEIPFRNKIEDVLDFLIQFRDTYPFLEVFNIQETTKLKNEQETIVRPTAFEATKHFIKEIEEEMKKGTIRAYHPVAFSMNIFALVSQPILMQPIYRDVFDLNEQEYQEILQQRKQIALTLLFN